MFTAGFSTFVAVSFKTLHCWLSQPLEVDWVISWPKTRINAGCLCLSGHLEYVWVWYKFFCLTLCQYSHFLLFHHFQDFSTPETKNNPVLETDVIICNCFCEADKKVIKGLFNLIFKKLFTKYIFRYLNPSRNSNLSLLISKICFHSFHSHSIKQLLYANIGFHAVEIILVAHHKKK